MFRRDVEHYAHFKWKRKAEERTQIEEKGYPLFYSYFSRVRPDGPQKKQKNKRWNFDGIFFCFCV
jgi:hypothetical protein